MNRNTMSAIEQTVVSLCKWIQAKVEGGASGWELEVLPEVVKATAELAKQVWRNNDVI